jgi:hypothetical protein
MADEEERANDNKKIAEILASSLVYGDRDAEREEILEEFVNLSPRAFRHYINLELTSDMFNALTSNIIRRIHPHTDADMLISEIDAATHDWEIMVNLYYKSKLIQAGAGEDLLEVVEHITELGRNVLHEVCEKLMITEMFKE